MSSKFAETTLVCWDGEEYTFQLTYGDLGHIQEKSKVGASRVADRLLPYDSVNNPFGGGWFAEDVVEPILLGLIRGKRVTTQKAQELVNLYVKPHLEANRMLAWAIIRSALVGPTDEPILGKAEGTETKANGSPMEKSPSNESTVPAQ